MSKPELTSTVDAVRKVKIGRLIASAWLAVWTAVGFVIGSVVFVINLAVWAVGFTLGWSWHAAYYGFRKGAQLKERPKNRPRATVA